MTNKKSHFGVFVTLRWMYLFLHPVLNFLRLLMVKSSLFIPPIQLVAGIMTLREPYGRDKHEWGQRSGKRQAAEYLHNNDKKNNPSWRLEQDGLVVRLVFVVLCLLSCVCINQLLCSCSSRSETSGHDGGKCRGSQSEFLNLRVGTRLMGFDRQR